MGLRENVSQALSLEGVEAEVSYRRIMEVEARDMGIKGSPTVAINGADIAPSSVSGSS